MELHQAKKLLHSERDYQQNKKAYVMKKKKDIYKGYINKVLICKIAKKLYNWASERQTIQLKNGAEDLNSYFQVSHVDGQQAYEKMLKIMNHQRNAV